MTQRTILIIIGFIWLISVLLSYAPVFFEVYGAAFSGPDECEMRPNLIYSVISSSLSFYIPLIIILFLYGRIFITARKHSNELQKLENIIKRLHSDDKFVLENAKWNRNIKAIRTLGNENKLHIPERNIVFQALLLVYSLFVGYHFLSCIFY
jgi:hypothetical protein